MRHLSFSIRPDNNLQRLINPRPKFLRHNPRARCAVLQRAVPGDFGKTRSAALVCNMPDFPLSGLVLDAHAAIAALHVHGIAAADFSGAIVWAVDARAPPTCGAADENDFACAHRDTIQLLEERNGGSGML